MQAWSYVSTPMLKPYMYKSIPDVISGHASSTPNKVILVHHSQKCGRYSITYNELETKANSLAKYFYSIGMGKGCCVSIFGPNTIEWAVSELAILKTGAVSVHLSMGQTDACDALDIIVQTKTQMLILEPGLQLEHQIPLTYLSSKVTQFNRDKNTNIKIFLVRNCPGLNQYACLKDITNEPAFTQLPKCFPEDPAIILTTSGSTGLPKLIFHSHFAIINGSFSIREVFAASLGTVFNNRPFSWTVGVPIFGLVANFARLFTDISEKSDSSIIWKAMKEEHCASAIMTPGMCLELCNYVKNLDERGDYILDNVTVGGQLIPEKMKRALGLLCHRSLTISYGSTESCVVSCYKIYPGDSLHMGLVGKPLNGVEVKVVNDDGYTVPIGHKGEICVRSQDLCLGNWNNPKGTKEMFLRYGWLKMGDVGLIDENNNLVIKGRMKDVISRDTRKIMPIVIENVIFKMVGIDDVMVIGVPDERLFEEVCVCFVSTAGIESSQVREFCKRMFLKDKTLDGYGEMPTYFVKFEVFPELINGKVDKIRIKREAINSLGI